MREFETLPEPAGPMWARMRKHLSDAIKKRIPEFEGWKLSGGTVLAAQWKHRESTDIDLVVDVKAGLALLNPRYDPSFEKMMIALGCRRPIHRQDQVIIPVGDGKVDLFAARSVPEEGHYRARVQGEVEEVMSNAQILAGKIIGRGFESPTRDVYDVAVAAETDPDALEIAINCIPEGTWEETIARWREAAPTHAMRAKKRLRSVPAQWQEIAEDPARAAINRASKRRYARVGIEWKNGNLEVTTECEDGRERKWRIETDNTRDITDELERHGVNGYLNSRANGEAERTLRKIIETRRPKKGLIHESTWSLEAPRKPIRKGGYPESERAARPATRTRNPTPGRNRRQGEPSGGRPKR